MERLYQDTVGAIMTLPLIKQNMILGQKGQASNSKYKHKRDYPC